MSGRPSWADRARVVRAALGRMTRPAITPGQGQAIRKTYSVHRSAEGTPVTLVGPPPLEDPDGGRRGD